MNNHKHRVVAAITAAWLFTGCSSSALPSPPSTASPEDNVSSGDTTATGIRVVEPTEGAAIQNDPPEDLVILDVRTLEEFTEGHLEDARMIDFYSDDFAEQLAQLDPDVPYLLYCRSGNRSKRTAAIMEQLDFVDVADIDGGILAWDDANLPIVTS